MNAVPHPPSAMPHRMPRKCRASHRQRWPLACACPPRFGTSYLAGLSVPVRARRAEISDCVFARGKGAQCHNICPSVRASPFFPFLEQQRPTLPPSRVPRRCLQGGPHRQAAEPGSKSPQQSQERRGCKAQPRGFRNGEGGRRPQHRWVTATAWPHGISSTAGAS